MTRIAAQPLHSTATVAYPRRRATAPRGARAWDNGRVTDGPLIVQIRQDAAARGRPRRRAAACRRAIAPFAELERAPEHVHTYRLTPLGLWNARAAGHDAEQVVDALLRYSAATRCRTRCSSTSPRRWPATAGCSCSTHPAHGLVLRAPRPRRAGRGAAQREGGRRCSAPGVDDDTVVVHPSRARPAQAGAAQARLAGRGPRRLRRRRGAPDRAATRTAGRCGRYQQQAADGFWHGGSGVVVLPCGAGKTIVGAAAMAQAQATTLILVTNTVAARQWRRRAARAHLADRGRDRRVLRRPQGDPAGHDRDVPGADHHAGRASTRTWSCSTPATGA